MIGNFEHQNPVQDDAAELKKVYDDSYTELATNLGIMAVKKDVLAVLQAGIATSQSEYGQPAEQQAGSLVAHHINVMIAPLQRDLLTASHDAEVSAQIVDERLSQSRQHYLENTADYITHAQSLAPSRPEMAESFVA